MWDQLYINCTNDDGADRRLTLEKELTSLSNLVLCHPDATPDLLKKALDLSDDYILKKEGALKIIKHHGATPSQLIEAATHLKSSLGVSELLIDALRRALESSDVPPKDCAEIIDNASPWFCNAMYASSPEVKPLVIKAADKIVEHYIKGSLPARMNTRYYTLITMTDDAALKQALRVFNEVEHNPGKIEELTKRILKENKEDSGNFNKLLLQAASLCNNFTKNSDLALDYFIQYLETSNPSSRNVSGNSFDQSLGLALVELLYSYSGKGKNCVICLKKRKK